MAQSQNSQIKKQEEILSRIKEHQNQPQRKFNGSTLLISLIVFAFIAMGRHTLTSVIYLVLVILLHELGHFVGMKMFGYANPRIFFIPGFGAAAGADSRSEHVWHEIVVLLLGPLPGLLLGIVLMIIAPTISLPEKNSLIFMLVFINAFNLLPFVPMDGGRVMSEALFRKKPILELLFKICGITILLILAFLAGDLLWGVFILFFSLSIREGYKRSRAAKTLREKVTNSETKLSEDDHLLLARDVVKNEFLNESLNAEREVKTAPAAKLYYQRIDDIYRESKINLMNTTGSIMTTIAYVLIMGITVLGIAIGSVFMFRESSSNTTFLKPDPMTAPELLTAQEQIREKSVAPISSSGEFFRKYNRENK